MTINKIKQTIEEMVGAVTFIYKNKMCGIDPIIQDGQYDMWYGEDIEYNAKTVKDVMNVPIFDGKSLIEIIDDIEQIEGI